MKTTIVRHDEPLPGGPPLRRMAPSLLGSLLVHGLIVALFVGYVSIFGTSLARATVEEVREDTLTAESAEKRTETFDVIDVDPLKRDPDSNLQFDVPREAPVSIPGEVNPDQRFGMDASPINPPVSVPPAGGYGSGAGGPQDLLKGIGNVLNGGDNPGGVGMRGLARPGTSDGRSGATREIALRRGGGTGESEAAVGRGLQWLLRQQLPSGAWSMNAGAEANDIAGTALGLLPFLAAGQTHKPHKDHANDKRIAKALRFLLSGQDKSTGYLGGGMYAHGLATIALCEVYGLSQDPLLRQPAQKAINLIVAAQNDTDFGWRYGPTKSDQGDLSISGWQIMALKSGMMANLNVPTAAVERAKKFLNASSNVDHGYGYTPGGGSTYRMTAVGLLCRQYMDGWGPSNPKLMEGIAKFITPNSPDVQDVYYYYYATQVMHHFGGDAWRTWNDKMRENLIRKQESNQKSNQKSANFGSWSPEGDPWARVGGRLMVTSLNLLTLEVYYRYLPLYYRDAGYAKDSVVQKAF